MEDINDRGRLSLHTSNSRRYNCSEALSDEECETPCTYTECILSVFLSGIPSVYVTGGYTEQRRGIREGPTGGNNQVEEEGRGLKAALGSTIVPRIIRRINWIVGGTWKLNADREERTEEGATCAIAKRETRIDARILAHVLARVSTNSLVHSNFPRASLIGVYEGQFNPTSREDPFNLVVYPYSLPGHLVRVVRFGLRLNFVMSTISLAHRFHGERSRIGNYQSNLRDFAVQTEGIYVCKYDCRYVYMHERVARIHSVGGARTSVSTFTQVPLSFLSDEIKSRITERNKHADIIIRIQDADKVAPLSFKVPRCLRR
ncbi:hypothetical protein ALC57_13974 [Trachymyrmex cornetzi]|uniref:Uncharacterized protein n=1 Tax=Trachymyrmex cornetzi TaxID=471704 RepID=A0A195DLX7_9HYME|nr:hypothetical protein ALC57_13974 [Trachymyrmex cornetzi]